MLTVKQFVIKLKSQNLGGVFMEETRGFDEILEMIKSDEEALSKFLKEDDVNEIYKTFREYGYSGTIEDIQNEILGKLHSDSILSEEQLSDIAGGKMDFKKGIAGAMSALALMGTVMPSTGAASPTKSQPNKVSSSKEIGTLEKIKYWGNQGVEKAKETSAILANKAKELYGKASENKLLKYSAASLGSIIVLGGLGYGGYRIMVGGKVVNTNTQEGAQLIKALKDLFDYTLNHYNEVFDADGKELPSHTKEYTELSKKAMAAWHAFATKYLGESKENSNVVAPGLGGVVSDLNRRLPEIKNTDSAEYKDAQTILEIARDFSAKKSKLAADAKTAAETKAKAEAKAEADKAYNIETLKEVTKKLKSIAEEIHTAKVGDYGENDKKETEYNNKLLVYNYALDKLSRGDYNKDDLSDLVDAYNEQIEEMNRKAQYINETWYSRRSAYAGYQEKINQLIEDMKGIKKNEAQQ